MLCMTYLLCKVIILVTWRALRTCNTHTVVHCVKRFAVDWTANTTIIPWSSLVGLWHIITKLMVTSMNNIIDRCRIRNFLNKVSFHVNNKPFNNITQSLMFYNPKTIYNFSSPKFHWQNSACVVTLKMSENGFGTMCLGFVICQYKIFLN